jgi:hypothetical protein
MRHTSMIKGIESRYNAGSICDVLPAIMQLINDYNLRADAAAEVVAFWVYKRLNYITGIIR